MKDIKVNQTKIERKPKDILCNKTIMYGISKLVSAKEIIKVFLKHLTCISGGSPSSRIKRRWLSLFSTNSFLKRPPQKQNKKHNQTMQNPYLASPIYKYSWAIVSQILILNGTESFKIFSKLLDYFIVNKLLIYPTSVNPLLHFPLVLIDHNLMGTAIPNVLSYFFQAIKCRELTTAALWQIPGVQHTHISLRHSQFRF